MKLKNGKVTESKITIIMNTEQMEIKYTKSNVIDGNFLTEKKINGKPQRK